MAITIAFPEFNDLGRTVTPAFLLMDHFLYQFSSFSEKMRKIYRLEVWIFWEMHDRIPLFLAELQRAKRASEAPWVRKIGNPSSQENLVMTSAYERPYVRTSVHTRGEGERRLEIFLTVTHTGN